jgi:hypothetical protein
MTVSIRMTSNVRALEDLAVYFDDIAANSREVAERVYREISGDFIADLQFYPPVPPNSRYRRTFRLRRGWTIELAFEGNETRLIVRNRTRYTQWVVGSLAQDRNAAGRFQRAFHARNGWPLATDTVKFWFDAYAEEFEREFRRELGEFAETAIKRRAATRIV